MIRLRTVEQAYQDIKTVDANSSVTRSYIRSLVNNNVVPARKTGKKLLIDMDKLEYYLEYGGDVDGKSQNV